MFAKLWRYFKLAILVPPVWALFYLACLVSGLQVLVCCCAGRFRQAGDLLHAMDCLAAASIGYSGRNTVSKECGMQHVKSSFCRKVCPILDWGDEQHCDKQVKKSAPESI